MSGRGNHSTTQPTDSLLTCSCWVRLPVCSSSRQHVGSEGGKLSSGDPLGACQRLGLAPSTPQQMTQLGLASQRRSAAIERQRIIWELYIKNLVAPSEYESGTEVAATESSPRPRPSLSLKSQFSN